MTGTLSIMKRKLAPRRPRQSRTRGAVQAVVDETIALYQWLAWVSDELYGDDARGASRRWTLRRLMRDGPLTVAALARIRTVRRQSLQPVVDALVREELLELAPNPAHARSPLVRLTSEGIRLTERLDRIDAAVLRSVARGITDDDLATTARTLGTIRAAFGTRMRWYPVAQAALGSS